MFGRSALSLAIALSLTHYTFAADLTTPSTKTAVAQEQSLTPTIVKDLPDPANPTAEASQNTPATTVSDLPSAADKTAPAEAVSPQTAKELQHAEAVVQELPKDPTADAATQKTVDPSLTDWSIGNLNQAQWTTDLGKGQYPVYARAQVLLNRQHASPGAIDGTAGKNMLKAISSFQVMKGLPVSGQLNAETWAALQDGQAGDAFISYTLTQADLDGPYAESIPHDYALQAKMKGLYYTRVTEMLGERFHMDETFLKKLNPEATFKKVGENIIVANPRSPLTTPVSLIIAHKGAKQVYAFDRAGKMIATFPATIGSTDTPSPKGTYKVKAVSPKPWYGYNPKNFIQGKNLQPLNLPPGPNNPVGLMWIALSKPSFGIHGTPEPSLISKTASHGCIRLTNWDAISLSEQVKPGVTVKFME